MPGIDANALTVLHFYGDVGNTGHTLNFEQNTNKFDKDVKKFGETSYDPASNEFAWVADHSDFDFGSGDFTLECWVRFTSLPGSGSNVSLIAKYETGTNQRSFGFRFYNDSGTYKLQFTYSTDGGSGTVTQMYSDGLTISVDTWYHMSVVRDGSTIRFFHDGVAKGTGSIGSDSLFNASSEVTFACSGKASPSQYVDGHLDEYRISNTARWTSGFTPATAEYESDANTVFLWHCNATAELSPHGINLRDDSAFDVTTKKWTSSLNLNGSSVFAAVFSNGDFGVGTSDFTIDCWFKTATRSTQGGYSRRLFDHGGNNAKILIDSSNGKLDFYVGGAQRATSDSAVDDDAWHHMAAVRASGTCTLYIDGVAQATTGSDSTSISDDTLKIGARRESNAGYWNGNVDEFRYSDVARWTSNFTPPTAPYSVSYSKRLAFDPVLDTRAMARLDFSPDFKSLLYSRRLGFDATLDGRGAARLQLDARIVSRNRSRLAKDQLFNVRTLKRLQFTPEYRVYGLKRVQLDADSPVWTKAGYTCEAVNVATGAVTDLGFIDAGASPLELSGINLAPGTYDLRFWLAGYQWQDWLQGQTLRVHIEGSPGGIVEVEGSRPPALEWCSPAYDQTISRTVLYWVWREQFGTLLPDDFAIWISTTSPVNTSGEPTATVLAETPREYDYPFTQEQQVYVAICARQGSTRGPYLTLTVPYAFTDPDNPLGQFAYRENVL